MEWILTQIRMKIVAILPPVAYEVKDTFHVSNEDNGSFSIGKVYRFLLNEEDGNVNKNWAEIWKLQVRERVCSFIWLVYHDRLLTNRRLNGFGFGNSSCNL